MTIPGFAPAGFLTFYLVREGYRSHKLKPYRKAAQAERKLEKANIEALFQKSVYENPAAASNPLSRWQQKQQIKKQYAAAKRAAQSGGTAAGAVQKTGKAAKIDNPGWREYLSARNRGVSL